MRDVELIMPLTPHQKGQDPFVEWDIWEQACVDGGPKGKKV